MAGSINAVAGGGSLISFTEMLAVGFETLGRWLREEALKHVFVVLPEITVSDPKASARFRVLLQLRQSPGGETWAPAQVQLIRVDAEEMARRSIERTHAPDSRRFWRRMSWRSSTWAASTDACATTTSAQR